MNNNYLSYRFVQEGADLTVFCCGKLNMITTAELSDAVMPKLSGITKLVFDFEELDYISSAGLRLLVELYKTMKTQNGEFVLRHTNEEIMNVFILSGIKRYFVFEE